MKPILKRKQKLITAVLVAVLAISCLYTMTLAAQPFAAMSAAAGEATGRAAAGFQDVPDNAYYSQAVAYCPENSLISGTGTETFSPNMKLSRGMLVTILWRNEGRPDASASAFSDVRSDAYYAVPIGWAAEKSIVSGYGNHLFGPDDAIQRQQLAAMLYRYAEFQGEDMAVSTPQAFADDDKISDYAKTSVAWAREKGIISGKGGNHFDPLGNATRAEAAAMVYRYLTKDANPVTPTPLRRFRRFPSLEVMSLLST